MTDPVTTGTGLTAGAVSVGALGWWAGLDPGVAIGAFWGAIFFV
ncbi:TPA: putative holin, partial [Klebsiella pneumoniae]